MGVGLYCCMGCEQTRPIDKAESDRCDDCRRFGDESARPVFRAQPRRGEYELESAMLRNRIVEATVHLRPSDLTNTSLMEWIARSVTTRLCQPGKAVTIVVTL